MKPQKRVLPRLHEDKIDRINLLDIKLLGTVCSQHSPGKRSAPEALHTDALRLPGAAFVLTRATATTSRAVRIIPGVALKGCPRVEGGADPGSDSDCCPLPDITLKSFAIIR